uniref:Uncharacterized protein n=1 Tax=Romanomermis culicivorax TaxID=13658 RepID=A0A915KET1_ROMCU
MAGNDSIKKLHVKTNRSLQARTIKYQLSMEDFMRGCRKTRMLKMLATKPNVIIGNITVTLAWLLTP